VYKSYILYNHFSLKGVNVVYIDYAMSDHFN